MPKVHLSGQNRNIPAHALNVPIKNTFEQSNVRFQVDGHYLTDMSDKGIEKFIKKHRVTSSAVEKLIKKRRVISSAVEKLF